MEKINRQDINYKVCPYEEFIGINNELNTEERVKYMKMLEDASKDLLPSVEYEQTTAGLVRVKGISKDYFDRYINLTLEIYDKKGISLYNSLLAQYYVLTYLEHYRRIKEQIESKKIMDEVTKQIFDQMSIEEIKDTYRFNTEHDIVADDKIAKSYNYSLYHLKDLKTIY